MKTLFTFLIFSLSLVKWSDAQVVTQNYDTTFYGTSNKEEYGIDVNQDGQIDLDFQFMSTSTTFRVHVGSNNNNEIVCPSYLNVTVFDSGQTVGPNTPGWNNPTGNFDPSGFFYDTRLAYRFWGWQGTPNGNFADLANKSVGFRFKVNNNWHYGYAEITTQVSNQPGYWILHKIGYESSPNTAILVGSQCATASFSSITTTACDNFVAPSGAVYTTSGSYTDVIPNMSGCDSTITINLTLGFGYDEYLSPSACDSYVSPLGNVYTSTGSYQEVVPGIAGCDSVYHIDLTIHENTTETISETVCTSYIAPSGVVLDQTGFYTDIISNAAGCDSIISIQLSVIGPVLTVTKSGESLIADMPSVKYQWLDCDHGYAVLEGEYDQTFLPSNKRGNYAVEITANGCVDTSECYSLETVGIEDDLFASQIAVFPNPTKSVVNIDLGNGYAPDGTIEIMTMTGQVLKNSKIESQIPQFDLSSYPRGIYLAKVISKGRTAILKLMKE